MNLTPLTLEGRFARLEPYTAEHAVDLWKAASEDMEIWRYIPMAPRSESDIGAFVAFAVAMNEKSQALGFAVRDRKTEEIAGASGYWNVSPADSRLEIGYTWLASRWQRTGLDTEMKLLMLEHAFEEGTLRSHMAYADGSRRDSVYYSVLAAEWPAVKTLLAGLRDR
jgi:RimJ/RimL family protein N-acetyltransferase